MKTTLLILAAGMGSRYGGLKQLDSIDEAGHTMLDYSVYDAIQAGFNSIVFVIRKEFESEFKEKISDKFKSLIAIEHAFQSIEDLPNKFQCPSDRKKPWGTAHAVWSARAIIQNPFAVINADDFYGRDAFYRMHDFCTQIASENNAALEAGLITYALKNTLSAHGSVNRGICSIQNGQLYSVEEYNDITSETNGTIRGTNSKGESLELQQDALVSMNFWGFCPHIFHALELFLLRFLENFGHLENSECYLPSAIDDLIQKKHLTCQSLKTDATWLGVTYPNDKQKIQKALNEIRKIEHYFE
jgi:UTP-glucose-1-phosphate uridylyltransferase